MKKLFFVLAIASLGFVSCNNDAADKEMEAKRVADSTRMADSMANMQSMSTPTTPMSGDSTGMMKMDSTGSKMMSDSMK